MTGQGGTCVSALNMLTAAIGLCRPVVVPAGLADVTLHPERPATGLSREGGPALIGSEEYAERAGRERAGSGTAGLAELRGIVWGMSDTSCDEWRVYRDRRQPTDEEWASAKSPFASGIVVRGVVLSHHRFGFFVHLGDQVFGLVEIPRVKDPGQADGCLGWR